MVKKYFFQIEHKSERRVLETGDLVGRDWTRIYWKGRVRRIILCLSLIQETLKFAVPPEVALLIFKRGENTTVEFS
jgi:hypothetical protein